MKSLAGRLAREGGGYQEREAPHRDEPTTHIDVKFKFRAATVTFGPRRDDRRKSRRDSVIERERERERGGEIRYQERGAPHRGEPAGGNTYRR